MRLSVFGMGKLGVAFSAAAASKGHSVVGVDVNESIVQDVNAGVAPFPEPELQDYLDEYGKRIMATIDSREAEGTDKTFVFVPTPSTDDGRFDNRYIYAVLDEIAGIIDSVEGYHLVTVASTVSPTSMAEFERYLEAESGARCGVDFGLCYSPSFIAQGTIIRDFLNPEILLVGGSDERARDELEAFWQSVIETEPTITRTNYINAELAKITFNVYSTMKISFANSMALLCGQHDGADVDTIMNAVKNDDRIGGPKLFKGGLGYGGPCLPRDNPAFRAFADYPEPIDIGRVTDTVNRAVKRTVVETTERIAEQDATLGILGLSYKPDTNITQASQALEIAEMLVDRGHEVATYDPLAEERTHDSLDAVLEVADTVLLLTPWAEFDDIDPDRLRGMSVLDIWRLHQDELDGESGYHAWGVNTPDRIALASEELPTPE
jgi:UDPglucose 6-dehydrogenase